MNTIYFVKKMVQILKDLYQPLMPKPHAAKRKAAGPKPDPAKGADLGSLGIEGRIAKGDLVSGPKTISRSEVPKLFAKYDVPISGYIVNRVIPPELAQQDIPAYLRNRIEMQEKHIGRIGETFGDEVLTSVQEFERDITSSSRVILEESTDEAKHWADDADAPRPRARGKRR